jgi:hypothetical protein
LGKAILIPYAFVFFLHRFLKNTAPEIRNIKRPNLNAYGMSMAFPKDIGLMEGFVIRNIRGEDGRTCFDLMKYGKIHYLRSKMANIWTKDRALLRDGNLKMALINRTIRELKRLGSYFFKMKDHNTKTSNN